MRYFFLSFCILVGFTGCASKLSPTSQDDAFASTLQEQNKHFESFSHEENFDELLMLFRENCKAPQTQKVYAKVCEHSLHVKDAKAFFQNTFVLKKVEPNEQRSMLTGYYEPLLHGSLKKSERFKYPVYGKPKDLIKIVGENDAKMRGRSVKGKVVPYFTREEIAKRKINAEILCYVDDKIDLFFMEVQGSGRVELEDGRVIFIGYADSNGHTYKSLGREMVDRGIFSSPEEVSMQKIKAWLEAHPSKIDALLNTNPSYVFFRKMEQRATGSLGVVLTPERSVAVDRNYIPLGSLVAIKSESPYYKVEKFVFAQDTGGAIKGPNRADMFMGYGERAKWIAGELKAPLEVWVMEPKF
ncbi:murein transglycosylase A [Sulfurospirillum barnesii]|uniref:peptidoglycan lytic exotransglycosylase n=1 Tax=Sulfurospirillum barnesii (strain ATCC 700032 / DSM 10660 / SES-3) TaxID=760154 RepID=I3Y039_SULBS|nr:MltA domain-containing protein [Sulfurospirillum barnesii]AFL69563.1 membrane-bound lytic murein transglycosylase [Sulfurospirillum barnesii SES-3]